MAAVTCPSAGCGKVVHIVCIESIDQGRFQCPSCRHDSCYLCKAQPFHRGLTCQQHKEKEAREEQEFTVVAKGFGFSRCPHCRVFIERAGGCNSMLCRCGGSFCYACGQPGCGGGHR